VLELCIENSWRGFNADWIEKDLPKKPNGHWADSEEATMLKGQELGCDRIKNEDLRKYRTRIQQILDVR
jgi:hypothetical protein